jgi:hypothetical protein
VHEGIEYDPGVLFLHVQQQKADERDHARRVADGAVRRGAGAKQAEESALPGSVSLEKVLVPQERHGQLRDVLVDGPRVRALPRGRLRHRVFLRLIEAAFVRSTNAAPDFAANAQWQALANLAAQLISLKKLN